MSESSRTSGVYASVGDHPSGRHDPGSLGRSPSRQTETDLAIVEVRGRLGRLDERVAALESAARSHDGDSRALERRLAELHKDFAVVSQRLSDISSAIARIEAQREKGGDRARDITRTVISVVTALAAIISLVVALATR